MVMGDFEQQLKKMETTRRDNESLPDKGHKWNTAPSGYDYCRVCGVMRRMDGRPPSKACPGPVPIVLRMEA